MLSQKRIKPSTYPIELEIDEGQLIFEALAELPFKYVYILIGKLNSRANEITTIKEKGQKPIYFLDQQELMLIVKALGAMPFNRVHVLLEKLNAQIQTSADYSQ